MVVGFFCEIVGDCIEVCFVGLMFVEQINFVVVVVMGEVGIDIMVEQLKVFMIEVVQVLDVVIMMGCGDVCLFFFGKCYEDWELDDLVGQGFEVVCLICDDICCCIEIFVFEIFQLLYGRLLYIGGYDDFYC